MSDADATVPPVVKEPLAATPFTLLAPCCNVAAAADAAAADAAAAAPGAPGAAAAAALCAPSSAASAAAGVFAAEKNWCVLTLCWASAATLPCER